MEKIKLGHFHQNHVKIIFHDRKINNFHINVSIKIHAQKLKQFYKKI